MGPALVILLNLFRLAPAFQGQSAEHVITQSDTNQDADKDLCAAEAKMNRLIGALTKRAADDKGAIQKLNHAQTAWKA